MAEKERNDDNTGKSEGKPGQGKRILLRTFGCQMNEYDSELIRAILAKENFSFATNEFEADIILLNTCSVRDHAVRKVHGHIHEIHHNQRKKRNPDDSTLSNVGTPTSTENRKRRGKPIIGVLGCMATNFREKLLNDKNLNIDFIAGPDSYKHLPELIKEAAEGGRKAFDVTLSEFETYADIYPKREQGINAWIAVMRGCDNFCTFCVVPYARGRERSRSPENIIEEAKRAADEGFCQVTLLGQNVNSYKYEGATFAGLLAKVAQIGGIKRIRFMSPHPKDFPQALLEVVAGNPKVCKHIHLPLQSGNDRILKLMNRGYSQKDCLALVDNIRKLCPVIALTTDIIVGFPTETDKEFNDTVKLMHAVEFDSAFIFKYSQRPGTIAEKKYPDDVSSEKKTARIAKLNEIQKEISLKKNKACIGQTFEVLIEQEGTARSASDFQGRTDGNKLVIFPSGGYRCGDFVKVKITDATVNVLKGRAVGTAHAGSA